MIYKDSRTKVVIICPIHGEFEQEPNSHLQGKGCNKCGYEKMAADSCFTVEHVIKESKKIHGDKYDYSNLVYKNNRTKFEIICPIHGIFQQAFDHHVGRKQGCPHCNESAGERAISL